MWWVQSIICLFTSIIGIFIFNSVAEFQLLSSCYNFFAYNPFSLRCIFSNIQVKVTLFTVIYRSRAFLLFHVYSITRRLLRSFALFFIFRNMVWFYVASASDKLCNNDDSISRRDKSKEKTYVNLIKHFCNQYMFGASYVSQMTSSSSSSSSLLLLFVGGEG